MEITPTPSDEEAAAIVAAVEAGWPRLVVAAGGDGRGPGQRTPAWRFSGRWWSLPVAARRERPWTA